MTLPQPKTFSQKLPYLIRGYIWKHWILGWLFLSVLVTIIGICVDGLDLRTIVFLNNLVAIYKVFDLIGGFAYFSFKIYKSLFFFLDRDEKEKVYTIIWKEFTEENEEAFWSEFKKLHPFDAVDFYDWGEQKYNTQKQLITLIEVLQKLANEQKKEEK